MMHSIIHSAYQRIKQFFTPILILLITAAACFLPGYAPILYFDDWLNYGQLYTFGGLQFFDITNRRPLLNGLASVLLNLFGLNLKVLFLLDVFVIFLCAVLVFFLARRLLPNHPYLALPAALLFLVFPADLTRLWLSVNFYWVNFLATLIVFYLLLDFAEKGGSWRLAVSIPLVAVPVFAHESHLGILVAWGVLLAVFSRRIPMQRRLLLLYPVLVAGLFALWRVYIQPAVLNVHDPYMTGIISRDNGIQILVSRFMQIFPLWISCWTGPFAYLLGLSTLKTIALITAAVVCSGLLALWVSNESNVSSEDEKAGSAASADPSKQAVSSTGRLSWQDKKRESPQLLALIGAGIVLLLAGYFPNILIIPPSLRWFGSRGNMFATFGAALALSSAIALAGFWAARHRSQVRSLVIAGMIPLILMGATEQVWMQKEARSAWAEQKHFWRALFQAVPNLKDGTTLVIAMPYTDPGRPFWRLPFTAQWEVTGGLDVLYNNPTLKAVPFTPNHSEGDGYAQLTPEGVVNNNYGVIPYDKVVVVYYVQGSYEVKVVRDINAEFQLGFQVNGYVPDQYILPDPPKSTPYRGLVVQ